MVIYAAPAHLYRYRPLGTKIEQEVDALVGQYIHCSGFSSMNDPMEGAHRISQRLRDKQSNGKQSSKIKEEMEAVGIASMSEVYDHEPMWAHYAARFTGMCVEYNTRRFLRGLPEDVALTRIMYSEQAPTLLDDGRLEADRVRGCLSTKSVRWASEREWRLFLTAPGHARYGGGNVVTRIYLGSRVSRKDEQRLTSVGEQLDIPVSKMTIESYSLSFDPAKPRVK